MTDIAENRAFTFNWFAPSRFALLLALLVVASFPQVISGAQTFIARDYGFFAYPLAYFQKQCFWHGQIPLWDPYNNCGIPFLAQWNTMPLYPPSLIYLLLPLTWSLSFFCLLHLWFGGVGMYFLARRWTANDFAAAFAGTAFSFSGMTLNLLMWPSHTATWSWMPWVVLAVETAWREGGRRMAIAAIAGAFQMLAGGPEIIFFTWLVLLALWIEQIATNEFPRRAFWRFPVIVALVAMMAAAQLLPFLDLTAHSQRQAGYADLRWSMPGHGWANFLVPMAFGGVRGEGIFFQNGQAWTSSYYLGIATLWLALLAIWKCRNRRVWLLTAVAMVGVICALGENTPIFPAVRKLVPQLSFITYPVKYLLLVTFVAPLLAAFSLARLREQKREIGIVGAVLLILMAAIIIWVSRSSFPNVNAHAALLNGFSRLAFLVLTGIVFLCLARDTDGRILKLAPLALICVAWLDVLSHEPVQNPTVQPGVYKPNLAREQLAMNPQPELGGPRAMVSPKAFLQFIQLALSSPEKNYLAKRLGYCADCNLLDGAPKVDGFFSLAPHENDSLISMIYGATNDFPRLDDFMGVSQITAPDEIYHWLPRTTFLPLVTAGQKPTVMSDWNALTLMKDPKFDGSKMVFLGQEDTPFVTITNGALAQVLSSKFGLQNVKIEVDAPVPSVVVVAQTYYHDWHSSVDGRDVPLLRANYAFQAVQVPQGRHEVVLRYIDQAFEVGVAISIIAWIVCLWAGLRRPHR
ncbi:MAG TPA: YfhO family protein [Candidatus Sulfotelmatobacter sp.]|nr:YfhO family protein [Candidatus Sulfotelmatobacter sp.]